MRLKTLCFCAVACGLALAQDAPKTDAPKKAASPIPHLEKRGTVTQLIVDGKPFLALAGELFNNSASTLENMRPLWGYLTKSNLNTALLGVSWSWIEPEEGKFDFRVVDGLLTEARRNNLRVVLLWFASWKNGTSSYCPAWVKRDFEKYPVAEDSNGRGREILTPLSDVNMKADARAFAALMRHVREVDSQARTVIMIQVENEVGLLGDSRDRSKFANDAFAGPVPNELMDYLQKHKDGLLPEFRRIWEAAGFKPSGTWEEVFGKGAATEEIFMGWYYSRYIGQVAGAGKKEYPLPMYVNAWLVQPTDIGPGDYPSGGPQAHMHDIWRAGAPQIDILSPDIYLADFGGIGARYSRNGNPLFIPETREDPANLFYAVGHLNAGMFSPFGVDRPMEPTNLLGESYAVLGQMAPLVLANQGKGTMDGVMVDMSGAEEKVALGGYIFTVSPPRGWGAAPPPPQAASSVPGWPPLPNRGFGLLISAGGDEYWVAGSGLKITAVPNTPGPQQASLAMVEEGSFVKGRWVVGRLLAGDDTGQGGEERASLQLPAGHVKILHFKLYRFK